MLILAILTIVLRAENQFVSVTSKSMVYLCDELLSKGGEGTVCAVDPDLVIKCDDSKSLNDEADLLLRFSHTASLLVDKAVPREARTPKFVCIVMRRLGPSLESLRSEENDRVWSWTTLASIGYIMINILEDFHRNGFVHTDFHPGNLLVGSQDRSLLLPIDLGDMRPAESDARNTALGYIVDDLKQAMVSLRYLRDGDRRFYAAKRFRYEGPGRMIITANGPTSYRDLLDYLYSIDSIDSLKYDQLRAMVISMSGEAFTEGRIKW
jgi:hypothetical protein